MRFETYSEIPQEALTDDHLLELYRCSKRLSDLHMRSIAALQKHLLLVDELLENQTHMTQQDVLAVANRLLEIDDELQDLQTMVIDTGEYDYLLILSNGTQISLSELIEDYDIVRKR